MELLDKVILKIAETGQFSLRDLIHRGLECPNFNAFNILPDPEESFIFGIGAKILLTQNVNFKLIKYPFEHDDKFALTIDIEDPIVARKYISSNDYFCMKISKKITGNNPVFDFYETVKNLDSSDVPNFFIKYGIIGSCFKSNGLAVKAAKDNLAIPDSTAVNYSKLIIKFLEKVRAHSFETVVKETAESLLNEHFNNHKLDKEVLNKIKDKIKDTYFKGLFAGKKCITSYRDLKEVMIEALDQIES